MVPASRLGVVRFRGMRLRVEVTGAVGWSGQGKESATFEDAVEDGFGEVIFVEHLAPLVEALVGRKDDGAAVEVAAIDDAIEDVGGVIDIGQVADLVDDEDIRVAVGGGGFGEAALAGRADEVVDEGGGGGKAGVEAVVDGAGGDGDG